MVMNRDMIPVFRFVLIAIVGLVAMALRAQADSPLDADDAVGRTGVVLKAGAIDSSTVEVGAFAVVIHGQGERQPVSGEWKILATARGYIQAVDAETLTLGLEGDRGAKQIALNRIQTLVLIGSPLLESTDRDGGVITVLVEAETVVDSLPSIEAAAERTDYSGVVDSSSEENLRVSANSLHAADEFQSVSDTLLVRAGTKDNMGTGRRIIVKLVSGALSGAAVGLVGGLLFLPFLDDCSEKVGPFCALGVHMGYVPGIPVGVSMWDSQDSFVYPLAGSLFGNTLAVMLNSNRLLLVLPPTLAILSSEWSREVSEARRFSMDLVPAPTGGLSAVATLRF